MNGKALREAIESASISQYEWTHLQTKLSALLEETNPETIIVGIFFVWRDIDVLSYCEDSVDLERAIRKLADERGGYYAGLPYDPNEFLDPDDDAFEPSDDGLSWVNFGDLWNALEELAKA